MLCLLLIMLSQPLLANHERNEPSDGTVKSFRAVAKPPLLPRLSIFDSMGQPAHFGQFRGKLLLINLWASWCAPCRRELPALQRLQQKFRNSDLLVMPISIDRQPLADTLSYVNSLKLKQLDFYYDLGRQMGRFFPIDVVPANFIVDRQGHVVAYLRSYVDWDDPMAIDMFNFYLQQNQTPSPVWHPPQVLQPEP